MNVILEIRCCCDPNIQWGSLKIQTTQMINRGERVAVPVHDGLGTIVYFEAAELISGPLRDLDWEPFTRTTIALKKPHEVTREQLALIEGFIPPTFIPPSWEKFLPCQTGESI